MRRRILTIFLFAIFILTGCGKQTTLSESNREFAKEYKKISVTNIASEYADIRSLYYVPEEVLKCANIIQDTIEINSILIDGSNADSCAIIDNEYYLNCLWKSKDNQLLITADDENIYLKSYEGDQEAGNIRVPREALSDDLPFYANRVDGDKNFVATHSSLFYVNASGEIIKKTEYDANSIIQAIQLSSEDIFAIYSNEDGKRFFASLDKKELLLTDSIEIDCYPTIIGEADETCFFSDGNTIYRFDEQRKRIEKLCKLNKFYIKSEYVRYISLDKNYIYVVYFDDINSPENIRIIKLEETDEGEKLPSDTQVLYDESGRQIVTIYSPNGEQFARSCFESAINDFNIENTKYYVEISDKEADIDAAIDSEINPDVICGISPNLISHYSSVGYLEDLWPYIDKSTSLRREDLNSAIDKLYGKDGHLYGIANELCVKGVRLSDCEDCFNGSWTVEEFVSWLSEHKDVSPGFGEYGNYYVLYMCIPGFVNSHVNMAMGSANFDNERFISNIEKIKSLRFESGSEEGSLYSGINLDELRKHPYLANATVKSIEQLAREDAILGKKIEFIGYPSDSNCAQGIVYPLSNVGITTESICKEGAYEFIEYWLNYQKRELERYKNNPQNVSSPQGTFYCLNSILEENIQAGLGEKSYRGLSGNASSDMLVFEVTSEYVDVAKEIMDKAIVRTYEEERIEEIIVEEVDKFLENQLDSKTAARNIDKRVNLFLSERR